MVSCVAAGRPAYWIVFTYFVHWYHQMYLLFCLQHLTSVIVILMHDVNNALWKIMCHIFQPSFLFFLENKVVCSRFQILWKIRGHILVTFLSHLKKIAFYTDFLTSKVDLGFFFSCFTCILARLDFFIIGSNDETCLVVQEKSKNSGL